MLPISLTIKGLYSYQKEQTIDFSHLISASVFGIFGNVGSGKSSILEAITFALFGETERMNIRDNRTYNMLNLKCDDLFIKFFFYDANQTDQYQIFVKGKRNRKNFEKVETFSRECYKMIGEKWVPSEIDKIPELIGLNYENFKRTIIIPQGQFQEFLQLSGTERSKMMKELFNLDRFELSEKVKSVENKTNEKKQHIEGQLLQIGKVNQEDIEKRKQELEIVKKQLESLNSQKIEKQTIEKEFADLQKLFQDIDMQKQILERLKNKELHYINLENQLKEYEFCRLNFENLLADQNETGRKINSITKEIGKCETEAKTLSVKIIIEEKKLDVLKTDYENRNQLKQKAEEFEKILKISAFSQQLAGLEKSFEKGQKFVDDNSEKIKTLIEQKEKLSLDLKNLKLSIQDIRVLTEIKSWFEKKNILSREILKQTDEIKEMEKAKNVLSESQNTLYSTIAVEFNVQITSDNSLEQAAESLQTVFNDMDIQSKQLETDIEQLNIQNRLEKFVTQLHEGKPCPLCGSLEHPNILNAKNVDNELRQAKKKKTETETQKERIRQVGKQCAELIVKQQSTHEQLHKAISRLSEIQTHIETHNTSFLWNEFAGIDEQSILGKIDTYNAQEKKKKKYEDELEKKSKELDEEHQRKEKYQQRLNQIINDMTECKTNINSLKTQISMLNFEDEKNRDKQQIEKEIKQLTEKFKTIPLEFEKQNNLLSELKLKQAKITGKIETDTKHLADFNLKLKDIENKINEKLKESKYEKIADVIFVLSTPLDKEKVSSEIERFRKDLHTAEKQLNDLTQKAEGKFYDNAQHERIKREIDGLKEKIKKYNEESGKIQGEIDKMQKDLVESVRLKDELEKLQIRTDNIKTLKDLFRSNGFVNYVSTTYLQNLCKAANERFFRLTGQKLSLELNEKNTFEVRDFMNEGKTRSVKTLSGGQTFQAALSLALALSDNIQKNSGSNHSFFFMDEGFGLLDKESLHIVFNTLKSLRKENRIVGIISHVEEMQQEIDCYLKIENDEHFGSQICASWE